MQQPVWTVVKFSYILFYGLIVDADSNSHISIGDYAAAMVNELDTPAHHQERFTLGLHTLLFSGPGTR